MTKLASACSPSSVHPRRTRRHCSSCTTSWRVRRSGESGVRPSNQTNESAATMICTLRTCSAASCLRFFPHHATSFTPRHLLSNPSSSSSEAAKSPSELKRLLYCHCTCCKKYIVYHFHRSARMSLVSFEQNYCWAGGSAAVAVLNVLLIFVFHFQAKVFERARHVSPLPFIVVTKARIKCLIQLAA